MRNKDDIIRKYADIIYANRPCSEESLKKHPRMSLEDRAKIFSPFAALNGHHDALNDENLKTLRQKKRILSEEEILPISNILSKLTKGMLISLIYFKADPDDSGLGNYLEHTGIITSIDPVYHMLFLDYMPIEFENIASIDLK